MKRFVLFCFFILGIPSNGIAQIATLKSTISLEAQRFIGYDNYKNLYFIQDRALHKTGNGQNFRFNALELGRITGVDIVNPLRILVFFNDSNTAVLLDNKLSEISRISFNQISGLSNISTASTAAGNSLWVFNTDSQQLELFHYKTRRHNVVSRPFSGKVIAQTSDFNYCFILNEYSLRAFNIYGSLLTEMEFKKGQHIAQNNGNVIVVSKNQFHYISDFVKHKGTPEYPPIILEFTDTVPSVKDLQLTDEFLYIYDGEKLHTYTLTLPKKN